MVSTLGEPAGTCARGPWRNLAGGEPLPSPLPGESPAPCPAEPSQAVGERDVGITMALVTWALPLTYLMLLLLRIPTGAGAQAGLDFELQQPQDKVSVTAGDTLTLTCTISGTSPLGPMKWLKGWDSGNETIYDQAGSFPRVTRVVSHSNTDFSIHIRDVCPEDAGTYYCVKFDKRVGGLDVFRRGKGTVVSVHGASLLSSPGLWFGILLEKGLLSGLFIFLFKRLRA